MTREEAIEILQGAIKKPNTKDGYLGQAIDMAIKALSTYPREDATLKDIFCMGCEYKEQESKTGWIPVSERLPEDRDWYLGIFKEPDTGWINPLPFICDYVGRKTKATTKEHWILRGFTDADEHIEDGYYFNLECVAWMPLPEPYESQESEDKE